MEQTYDKTLAILSLYVFTMEWNVPMRFIVI